MIKKRPLKGNPINDTFKIINDVDPEPIYRTQPIYKTPKKPIKRIKEPGRMYPSADISGRNLADYKSSQFKKK